ncbi:WD40-repeat-containing domain protein [Mycena leptocephala]|nr:WD40-repeat-containing domain protein [Mycena leptocephala]
MELERRWEGCGLLPLLIKKHLTGLLVTGSSDCTVCVWDLWTERPGEDAPVHGEVRAVLRGHGGGVLDLRVDGRWVVSCSKDAAIRVWARDTLALHRTLRGHEGPVNAVGLQSGGRVVSASGDGKMILWDIASGERVRTFEGHDRGLACIEFKEDLIISGSNDCKIKIWSASSGACLRTLVGHEALVRALSFDAGSGRLVSASYDKSVRVWDLATGRVLRVVRDSHTSHIFDVKFDGRRIVR